VKRFLWDRPRMVVPRGELKAGLYYLSGEGLQSRHIMLK
jgi:hypothetical protein